MMAWKWRNITSMIHKELKRLRAVHQYTLKELSSKVGYGTGNLSSYENGKLQARDETLMRMLTRGYDMSKEEAKARIAMWRRQELESRYKTALAQAEEKYNEKPMLSLEAVAAYLTKHKVSEKIIEGLKKL